MPLGPDLPIRRSGHVRRQSVRRASAPRLRLTQVYALFLMLLCVAAVVSLGNSNLFDARRLEVYGATFTGEKTVRDIVQIDATPNLFRLRTDRIVRELEALPAVEFASVDIRLPDTVVVTLIERTPRLVWAIGERRFAVDSTGLLFGEVDRVGNPVEPVLPPPGAGASNSPDPFASPDGSAADGSAADGSAADGSTDGTQQDRAESATRHPIPEAKATATPKVTPKPKATPTPKTTATPSPTPTAVPRPSLLPVPPPESDAFKGPDAVDVPVVYDRRASSTDLTLGAYVDPIALDAGYRLAGVTPTELLSSAETLAVVVDDDHGFTISSGPDGWVAEFGFYTETLRQDTVIPTQIRDLRSALDHFGESKVAWIFLMSDISESHINTVILK